MTPVSRSKTLLTSPGLELLEESQKEAVTQMTDQKNPPENTTSTPTDALHSSEGADIRILVVDDVAVNREILRRWLERRGFKVVEACDGVEALEVLDSEAVDLILLDIMMPRMGGVDVVRAIRSSPRVSALPIIMVSAKSMNEDVSQCIEAGANAYIMKPVDFKLMLARISEHLEPNPA